MSDQRLLRSDQRRTGTVLKKIEDDVVEGDEVVGVYSMSLLVEVEGVDVVEVEDVDVVEVAQCLIRGCLALIGLVEEFLKVLMKC